MDRDQQMDVRLAAGQWEAVLQGATHLPYYIAAPLIDEIKRQCVAQVPPSAGEPEVEHV